MAQVRQHWLFRFDWFIKSRTPVELARRCETLIRLIEKEFEVDAGDKRRNSGSGADKPNKKVKAAA